MPYTIDRDGTIRNQEADSINGLTTLPDGTIVPLETPYLDIGDSRRTRVYEWWEKRGSIWAFSMSLAVASSILVPLFLSPFLFEWVAGWNFEDMKFLESIGGFLCDASPFVIFGGGIVTPILVNVKCLKCEPCDTEEWWKCMGASALGSIATMIAIFLLNCIIIAVVYVVVAIIAIAILVAILAGLASG